MKIIHNAFNNNYCVMHLYLQYPMILCKWAGFFPIDALNQPISEKTRLNLRCPYIFYCAVTLIGQISMTTISLFQLISRQLTLSSFSSFMFYATALSSTVLFLRLALTYPEFLKEAVTIERYLTEVRGSKRFQHRFKANIVAFTVMGMALVENILSVVFVLNLVMNCVGEFTLSATVFQNYFVFRMPYIYKYTSYSIWKAVLLEVTHRQGLKEYEIMIANTQSTFLWSFTDVLIMCFSVYLISFCQDINRLIYCRTEANIENWGKMRIHYCHLMALIRLVDSKLNYFVLLAFFNDLYFICLQLFNTLNQGYSGFYSCGQKGLDEALGGVAHSVYYWYSFVFLIMRAMIMTLLASTVHETARKPIFALRNVAASVYNAEVQRFQDQITHTKLALSGLFFHITRHMILKVAAIIVTYELVLLQFSKEHGKHSSKNEEENVTTVG